MLLLHQIQNKVCFKGQVKFGLEHSMNEDKHALTNSIIDRAKRSTTTRPRMKVDPISAKFSWYRKCFTKMIKGPGFRDCKLKFVREFTSSLTSKEYQSTKYFKLTTPHSNCVPHSEFPQLFLWLNDWEHFYDLQLIWVLWATKAKTVKRQYQTKAYCKPFPPQQNFDP